MHACEFTDFTPLYTGAPLSNEASWLSIYHYAVSNQLTDRATRQLLDLVRIHCPSPNSCPPSLYKLKKQYHVGFIESSQFCSGCMSEVPKDHKRCLKRECRMTKSQLCYFSVLPFEQHLQEIFTGMYIIICYLLACINSFVICFSENWADIQYPFTRRSVQDCIDTFRMAVNIKSLCNLESSYQSQSILG